MEKPGYYIGLLLQIICTLFYILIVAALINDLSYFYDRQMFAGAENVLYAGFIKQLILYTVIYVIFMFIALSIKLPYKHIKKKQKRVQK